MKTRLFSLIFTIVVSVGTLFAEKVQIGELYYNLNETNLTAEVAKDNSYSNLTTANIPATVTYNDIEYSVTSIGDGAFNGCTYLTSITIPNSITTIETRAFDGCSSLTSVTIPSSVTSIFSGVFHDCNSLASISVANENTVYDSRSNCNAIIETATNKLIIGCKNSIIPNSVKTIDYLAFSECLGLKSITIPNSVTLIGEEAFSGCTGLTTLSIGKSVDTIVDWAFLSCSSLEVITCEAIIPPVLTGDAIFEGVDKSIPLYVPSESVETYNTSSWWQDFTNIQPIKKVIFPGDPGLLKYNLELSAADLSGENIQGWNPEGSGGYTSGESVTITAQDIPGYEFVRWSDYVTDNPRTIVIEESLSLTALYTHSMIEIPVAANKWTFICLPPLGDRQYTADMFTYDGLSDVQWGTYNGSKRAAGQSGWETPETFNAMQGYIIYSSTTGTLRINAYQDDIRQGESGNTIHAGMIDYASSHAQNANWNFVGNPYPQGYNIAGFAAADITSPITVWNGTAYTTYTPGIDSYILNPFEAFFIQKAENGAEYITFSPEYMESNGGNGSSTIEGELSGAFSVAEGRQVHFSRGNLQYQASTDTWRFAENQYSYCGDDNRNISESYSGWIDLFGWGTGDNPTLSSQTQEDYGTYEDWGTNAISNGGNKANLWRTLTLDEWAYIFQTRNNASALYGHSTVNGTSGMIILPDDWQSVADITFTSGEGEYSQNTYTTEQWSKMESAGAVFLPTAGLRYGVDMGSIGSHGSYWTSTTNDTEHAGNVTFESNRLGSFNNYHERRYGLSVRLVR